MVICHLGKCHEYYVIHLRRRNKKLSINVTPRGMRVLFSLSRPELVSKFSRVFFDDGPMLPLLGRNLCIFFYSFSQLPPYQCSAPESARGDNSISQKILTPSRNSLNHPASRIVQSESSACYRPLLIGRRLSLMHSPDVRISHGKTMQKPCQKCCSMQKHAKRLGVLVASALPPCSKHPSSLA